MMMKKIVLLCSLCLPFVAQAEVPASELQAAVDQQNRSLPKMVGNGVRLDRTELQKGSQLVYYATMTTLSSGSVDKQSFSEKARTNVMGVLCGNPDSVNIMKLGVTYRYIYRSNDNQKISDFHIAITDC